MANVTLSFALKLRELSLSLSLFREQRAVEGTIRLSLTAKETRDRMVEQRKMDTGSPCSDTAYLYRRLRIRSRPQSSRKCESLCWEQAHHKLDSTSDQIGRHTREPHSRNNLERKLSR